MIKKLGLCLSVLYIFSAFSTETFLLHDAVNKGQVERVTAILDEAKDAESLVNTEGTTTYPKLPLHIAINTGYVE